MSLLEHLERRDTHPLKGRRKGDLSSNILSFCHLLRELRIEVTLGRMIDVHKALKFIDVTNRGDFYCALKANLVSSRDEAETFDRAFQLFWTPLLEEADEFQLQEVMEGLKLDDTLSDISKREERTSIEEWLEEGKGEGEAEEEEIPGYSPLEVLGQKDFSSFHGDEVRLVRRAVAQVARKLATRLSLRKVPDSRGRELDLRRSFRRNIRYAGDVVELIHRRKKVKKTKLVLICDVSGSMDCYTNFLIQFMYGLQNELSGVETLVFSTRLTRITNLLKRRGIEEALREISRTVLDWSGGTNIGMCLKEFNDWLAKDMLTPRTVVIILSDGWDRGDPNLLKTEMRRLKSNCYKVIWLNPLLGSSNYQPLCQGIRAALPFIDYFLPVHNLETLIALGRTVKPLLADH